MKLLADVGGRLAVDRRAALEQRDRVAAAAGQHDVRVEAAAHDLRQRDTSSPASATSRTGASEEVDRAQQVAERERVLRDDLDQQRDQRRAACLVALLAGHPRQAQQAERGGRAAGGDRGVLEVLAAGDQARVVVGDREEAAALGVVEALEDGLGRARGRA